MNTDSGLNVNSFSIFQNRCSHVPESFSKASGLGLSWKDVVEALDDIQLANFFYPNADTRSSRQFEVHISNPVQRDRLLLFSALAIVLMTQLGKAGDSVGLERTIKVNTMISNVKNSIHGTYHAINQKHLPRYLAEFSFKFNHRFNLEWMVTDLARAGVRTAPMPQRLLKLAESRW